MDGAITYRHNAMTVQSLDGFFNVTGGYRQGLRDVYFVRALGELPNMANKILEIDRKMNSAMDTNRLKYYRLEALPAIALREDMEFYSQAYLNWKTDGHIRLRTTNHNVLFEKVLSDATNLTIAKYRLIRPSVTETILKNFVVKLWFWTDYLLKDVISQWTERTGVKIVAANVNKDQEFLFYYMVTCLGCDVLILNTKADTNGKEEILALSAVLTLGAYGNTVLPKYEYRKQAANKTQKPTVNKAERPVPNKVERPTTNQMERPAAGRKQGTQEKSFEELALLASSIVMIAVHDLKGNPVATGSGIMIGKKGYILTNCHVIREGTIYAVRIEDDEQVYLTHEVIKYNPQLDLAVLRIDRELSPLPIYDGRQKLVRGQKVVAIGSPLGLFNSVSDGIISGFRNIRDVDMIQFTAPISHGSSGGAVLNMYGEVIGISTAGIDSGQNINLAVGYENIRMFARGFY